MGVYLALGDSISIDFSKTLPFRHRYNYVVKMSVGAAAEKLGISRRRVTALINAGRLPATRVGREWLVDLEFEVPRRAGRPLSADMGWGILAVLAGDEPDWVDGDVAWRLHRYIEESSVLPWRLATGQSRSAICRLRVLPLDLESLERHARVVPTGLAGDVSQLGLVRAVADLDAYVSEDILLELRRSLLPLENARTPNVTLRVPTHPWILGKKMAPLAVIAADLLHDPDPRVAESARSVLQSIRA